jgi:O-antigen/teichoic acid export membrane protein
MTRLRSAPWSRLLTPLSVLVANATGFLVYLLLPKLLAPSEFALFSLLMSGGAFGVSLVFEWARHGLIRFSYVSDAEEAAAYRATLEVIYSSLAIGVAVVGAVCAALGASRFGAAEIVALFALVVAQALFDGRQAQARATFRNVSFSLAWCVRSVLNIGLAVAAALVLKSAVAAAWAFALSNALTYLLFNDRFALLRRERAPDGPALRTLLHYGAFIAASASLTALFPVAVRYLPSHALGLGQVAGLMLAFDISTKAIAMTGLMINLLALQGAIHAMEKGGIAAGREKASRQLSLVLLAILPTGLLAIVCQPWIAPYFVPPKYMESYMAAIAWAVLAAIVLTFRTYAVDTVFIVARRSALSIVGPIVTIVVAVGASGPLAGVAGARPETYAEAAVIGAIAGTIVAFVLARRALAFRVDARELSRIVLALCVLALPLALVAANPSVWLFAAAAVAGCVLYAAVALALDIAGLRRKLLGARPSAA